MSYAFVLSVGIRLSKIGQERSLKLTVYILFCFAYLILIALHKPSKQKNSNIKRYKVTCVANEYKVNIKCVANVQSTTLYCVVVVAIEIPCSHRWDVVK